MVVKVMELIKTNAWNIGKYEIRKYGQELLLVNEES